MPVLPLYDDEELLSRLRAGDEEAFNIIYRKYWRPLYNEAYKRLHNIGQSEEIVQEIFAYLWVKRAEQHIIKLLPYLLSSVRYQVFMLYKKEKSLPFLEEPLEHMAEEGIQADSYLYAKELRLCIDAWLEQQPEKRAEIFRLRFYDDLSTKEISEKLGIPQKTVKNILLTAKNGLRISMDKILILLPLLLEQHKY